MLRDKTLDEVARQVNVWRPNLVYFSSGASPVTEAGHRTLTTLSFKAADGEITLSMLEYIAGYLICWKRPGLLLRTSSAILTMLCMQ